MNAHESLISARPRHLRSTANPTEAKNIARLRAVEIVGAFLRAYAVVK